MADQILADPQASPQGQAQTPVQQTAPVAGAQVTPPPVEVQYDLKAPDNALFDNTHLEQFKGLAKELGLTPEAAQKLVERDNQLLSGFVDKRTQEWSTQTAQWGEQVKADKELGGENFNSTVTSARTALDRFASPEFKRMLNETGYGNHPELVRLFANIGKAMKEDRMVSTGAPVSKEKTMAEIFYPGMAKKE